MTPRGYQPQVHVTLTDDYPLAEAVVLITGIDDLSRPALP